MNRKTITGLICCGLLICCNLRVRAQINSDSTLNTSPVDSPRMQILTLTPEEMAEIKRTSSYPIWNLIAPVLNLGIYYSYISPTGTFKQKVSAASAFSFDVGLDLTRIIGKGDADLHVFAGLNGDFTNFGKSKSNYSYSVGDTTYTTSVKNSLEVISYYLELEYRRYFVCPFVSAAYSTVYLNPYKEQEMKIVNKASNTNVSEVSGDYLADQKSRGINLTWGLNWKYKAKNAHTELMLVTKMSYVKSSSVQMVDMESVRFSNTGTATYTTSLVHPSWLMYSLGLKLNF